VDPEPTVEWREQVRFEAIDNRLALRSRFTMSQLILVRNLDPCSRSDEQTRLVSFVSLFQVKSRKSNFCETKTTNWRRDRFGSDRIESDSDGCGEGDEEWIE
jgi:hypothetical protein